MSTANDGFATFMKKADQVLQNEQAAWQKD